MNKFVERIKKLYHEGTIIVVKEKHGDRYFDASTLAKAGAVARLILKERLEDGWYDSGGSPIAPGISEEALLKLKEHDPMRDMGLAQWREYKTEVKEVQAAENFVKGIKGVLYFDPELTSQETKDSRDAASVDYLGSRSGHEYERWDVVNLESVEE